MTTTRFASCSSHALNKLSRRDFLKLSSLAAASLGLTACGPAAEDDTTEDETTATSDFGSDGTLRVGMEAAYAPYNWQATEESEYTIPIENVSGAYADGYDVQIAKTVADGQIGRAHV